MKLAAASLFFPSSSSLLFSHKPSPSPQLRIPPSTLSLSPNYHFISHTRFPIPNNHLRLLQFSSAQQVLQVEDDAEEETRIGNQDEKRRKLVVFNLPWGFSPSDINNLFSQCGVVKFVEVVLLLLFISGFWLIFQFWMW